MEEQQKKSERTNKINCHQTSVKSNEREIEKERTGKWR